MSRERPGLRRAAGALAYRDFRLYYVALMVAGAGGQIQTFSNTLQIYELTHSAVHLGLTGIARGVPIIVFSLMGGVIADRVDRLKFSIVAQTITGSFSIVLAILTFTHSIEIWHIYAFIFLGSMVQAINAPSRSAIIPNVVPREHLMNAIALNSTVFQSSNILGPMVAGLTIAWFGFWQTYLLNGLAQLISIGTLACIRIGPVAVRSGRSPMQEFVEGLAFVRRRSIILVLLATDCAETLVARYQILLPILADADHLAVGPQGLGMLAAAPGLGSLIGSGIIISLGDIRYKGLVTIGAILAYCGALAVLALSPWFGLALAATFMLGMFDAMQAAPRSSVIQMVTPDELRGRVSSFQSMLTGGMPSFGQAYSGALAAIVGAPAALLIGAGVCAAVQLGIVTARPDLRAANLGAEGSGLLPTPDDRHSQEAAARQRG